MEKRNTFGKVRLAAFSIMGWRFAGAKVEVIESLSKKRLFVLLSITFLVLSNQRLRGLAL